MTTCVLLEGFEKRTGKRVVALRSGLKQFDGYPLSRRPRSLIAKEVDAIIGRFSVYRLKGLRYAIRLGDRPTAAVGEKFYEVHGFAPASGRVFFSYTDDEHILSFDFIRKTVPWRLSEELFAAGVSQLKPMAAKVILEKLDFEPVEGANYDIDVVMQYPRLGPRKYFSIEVRHRGHKHFRNYLTLGRDRLTLRQVDAIVGSAYRGRRDIVPLTPGQVVELCSRWGLRQAVDMRAEYRISRESAGERVLW